MLGLLKVSLSNCYPYCHITYLLVIITMCVSLGSWKQTELETVCGRFGGKCSEEIHLWGGKGSRSGQGVKPVLQGALELEWFIRVVPHRDRGWPLYPCISQPLAMGKGQTLGEAGLCSWGRLPAARGKWDLGKASRVRYGVLHHMELWSSWIWTFVLGWQGACHVTMNKPCSFWGPQLPPDKTKLLVWNYFQVQHSMGWSSQRRLHGGGVTWAGSKGRPALG